MILKTLETYVDELNKLLQENATIYSRIAPTILQVYEINGKHLATIELDTFSKTILYKKGKIYGTELNDEDRTKLNKKEIISLNGGCRFGSIEVYVKSEENKLL